MSQNARNSLDEIICSRDNENCDATDGWRKMMQRSKMAMNELKEKINLLMDANNVEEIKYL